ncbi:MAG: galactose mutarotase [Bacteroidetes bacterium]|nr:galactose mutarotase [Bacteroidota bacterium]
MKMLTTCLAATVLVLSACHSAGDLSTKTQNQSQPMEENITKSPFGTLPDGTSVDLYTLTNKNGLEAKITNYGGIVVSLKTPDRNGKFEDIVLGYDSLAQYVADNPYFGAIVGRYGNRIAKGRFTLEGKTYTLAKNNGENHLHGGLKGFDKAVWEASPFKANGGVSLTLSRISPDMEEGYPGNLELRVIYSLTNDDKFQIEYSAASDKSTHINLTHHSYFNLTGNAKRDILGHVLNINSRAYMPVDSGLIPLGFYKMLAGTPFDFQQPKPIGQDINAADEQLKFGQGYDHCWVLTREAAAIPDGKMFLAATVYEPESGRVMEISTTEPGIQFYSGNFLDGKYKGKGGVVYQDRWGFCLETQHMPDSPNHPEYPPTVLSPGFIYSSATVHKFSVK